MMVPGSAWSGVGNQPNRGEMIGRVSDDRRERTNLLLTCTRPTQPRAGHLFQHRRAEARQGAAAASCLPRWWMLACSSTQYAPHQCVAHGGVDCWRTRART